MRDYELFSLYNAGMYLRLGKMNLLVDALEEGYPPYEASDWEMLSLNADALLFTHKHPDHFCARMVFAYLQEHPLCRVYGGREVIDALASLRVPSQRLVTLEAYTMIELGEKVEMAAFPTRHMGPEYRRKEHLSLLLHYDGLRFLLAGDAAPVHNSFERDGCPFGHVDVMIAPYVYAMYEPAQRIFAGALQTDVLVVNHIPEPDTENIRDCLRAIPAWTRAYKLIVTERTKEVEVN